MEYYHRSRKRKRELNNLFYIIKRGINKLCGEKLYRQTI